MKKIIALILIALTIPAMAQHRHGRGHYSGSNWGWVAPAIIGGVIVYGVTRPTQPPPVVYQPQLPPPPGGFHYEQILDAGCNCYRWVLVQG